MFQMSCMYYGSYSMSHHHFKDCPIMLWSDESGGPYYIDLIYCCKKCHKKRRKVNYQNKKLNSLKEAQKQYL